MLILVYLLLLYIQVNDAYLLYQHGTDYNEMFGGTCKQFKMLNNLQTCCPERDDNCYMLHFDSRCYCDSFCQLYNTTDCCPDSFLSCARSESVTLNTITNDNECNENDFYMKDCNKCQKNCSTGLFECGKINECLINTDLLNEINNDKKSSWTAFNYPEFESKYLSYGYIHKLGTRLDESRKLRKTFNYDYDSSAIQPIDYRQLIKENNNNHINDSNDNDCGISWALSTLDVVYDRIALLKNNNFDTLPSVGHLLNCLQFKLQNSKCTQTNGTGVHTAWHLLEHKMLDNGTTKHGGILNKQCYDYMRKTNKFINICNVNDLKKYKCNDLTRPKLFRASSVKLLDSRKIVNIYFLFFL